MQTVLFHETIFGPIHSRRLGTSLGVNLSPNDGKICSFDCLYCEAGFNAQGPGTTGFPLREKVKADLEAKLKSMKENGERLDVITFSGNGEPTLHPEFGGVVDDTIALRDKYFPDVKISVLSNSTRAGKPEVAEALKRVDNNIVKLDSAIERTMRLLDRPNDPGFTVERVVGDLAKFGTSAIVQTMFTRGEHNGEHLDNTTDEEVTALIEAYRTIGPGSIMIYSIDRRTPEQSLQRVMPDELRKIADRIEKETGIPVATA
ncbi:MAG: radical SAM protein [Muribaculaceae bacterium]|nr:radical SAM protein [Muribaculaceae bacterium]